MTRNRYRAGVISVLQQKTGARLEVPVSDDLKAILGPWLRRNKQLTLLTTRTGKPLKIDDLRHLLTRACAEAGLKGVTTHDLRYTAGTILAELGCYWPTIASILGHRTAEIVRKYTGNKRQARLAIARVSKARRKQN